MRRWTILIMILHKINWTIGCPPSCPKYTYQPHDDRNKMITDYPDSLKINKIALIGTRESIGYKIDVDKNQNLELIEQLNFGVRVLDIGVRATSNRFAVHRGAWYLNIMFGSVIQIVNRFLEVNSGEFVIMVIRNTHSAAWDVTKSNCEILHDYMTRRMVTNWTLDDTVGKHRGKLLLATIGDKTFGNGKCLKDLKSQCRLSSQLRTVENYDRQIQVKKRELKALQNASFTENYKCFISYLSDRYMNSRFDVAVKGTDRHCDVPINVFMADYFRNSHRGLIILLAEYPTQELIDRVIESNLYVFPSIQ